MAYLWMLFLVFLLGLGLGKTLEVYSTAVQREKEAELIYVGGLYREAIRQFYLGSPGSVKRYPVSLEELLKDPRSLAPRRYLRQLYPDPITGKEFISIPAPTGGIWGVRSASERRPMRTEFLPEGAEGAEGINAGAMAYSGWQFVYSNAGH